MELVVFSALALLVAVVAIDAFCRRDPVRRERGDSAATTQKIIVDLSRRR